MDEQDLRGLLESFQFIPDLQELHLSDNPLGHDITSIVPHVINLKKLEHLNIDETSHSEDDLNNVRDIVKQALPKLVIFVGQGFFPSEDLDFFRHFDDDDDDDDDNDDDDDDDDG